MAMLAVRDLAGVVDTETLWLDPRGLVGGAADWAIKMNEAEYNIYMSWCLFRAKRRRKEDMIATGAFVADWDGGLPRYLEGAVATLRVQTSAGRFQDVYVLREPIERDAAQRSFTAAQGGLGCDACSADIVHEWRVPGTVNWPNTKKKGEGRKPVMSRLLGRVGGRVSLPPVVTGGREVAAEWPEKRVGKALPRWMKAALTEEVDEGDRSEKFYKLVLRMAEAGMGLSNIVDKLRGTFAEEKYGKHLSREVERCVEKSGIEPPKVGAAEQFLQFNSSGKERHVAFLWDPYIPREEVTIVDGDGGAGKTTLMLRISRDLLMGAKMPNGKRVRGGHRVLYVSVEADFAGVTLPVLKRMGLEGIQEFYHVENPEFFLTSDGMTELADLCKRLKIDMVVIDNLVDYMPEDVDMNDYRQTSRLLLELRALVALPNKCAVVVLRHNTKGSKDKLSQKGMGSMGIHKAVRSQLTIVEDEEVPGAWAVINTKNSYRQPGTGFVYQFVEIDGRGIIEWIGTTERTAAQYNDKKSGKSEGQTRLEEASAWLRELLTGKPGGVESTIIFDQGEARGFNRMMVHRAGTEVEVVKSERQPRAEGRGTVSFWRLESP